MSLRFYLELVAQRVADFCFMLIPRRQPSIAVLRECRIVSHRGEHDNRRVRENTMAAFGAAVAAGVWGIEFDLRWTRDLHPVVIHDPTTGRVFDADLTIAELGLEELRRQIPEIPTLSEVVAAYGGNTHLMVELKPDQLGEDALKSARLAEIFSPLAAERDYHFLGLQPDLFELVAFAGKASCLLVAELQIEESSRQVIEQDYGGLCGQYLLLSDRLVRLHRAQGQKLGTGFPTSRYCFYRELNRGIDWIFTDDAVKLEAIRARLLRED